MTFSNWRNVVVLCGAALFLAGCKESEEAKAQRDAALVFNSKCATCHGLMGNGKGPGSEKLNPKPRDYTNKEWQKTVTDEQISKTIVYGGLAVGKSAQMPAHPELAEKPAVVKALVETIRGFAK